uniref:Gypsy type transposon n=1 Tax=Oryza sativa subsp. japonica TaxID=39947 RepID=Q75LT8_ORYSJ|nr:putative gypsy type transposon [Oryza sativa Japonica Group]
MDLDKSTPTSASLKELQEDGALPGHGTAEREVGGTEPQPVLGRIVAIEDFILCGFLPPPSEFLLLVFNFYGLSLLHLNPNSIAFLSIFSHLCEAYIRVEPFLDLFRFYYELRWMEPKKVSGKWRGRWFYLQIEDSDPVFVVPEEQQDKIPSWTTKPALTPSLQSFIDIIDDLRERGLSGYEVAADFIGLDIATVERRVGQLIISGSTTASNVPVPLCEKGAAERDAAINVVASLKEKVAQEASDAAAAAATTSGGNVAKKGRNSPLWSDIVGRNPPPREAWREAEQDGSGGTSSASPAVASTDVVVAPRSCEATPSGLASDLAAGRGPPAAVLTWEELQVEMGRLPKADLESALADQDRRIHYWRTKFEVAELERTMLEVKKDQAVETLRGREVWFNSYLKSCCTSMSRVCRELRVPRGDPEESAAGYISWLNGACTQLEGIGQRIDEALKQQCRRSSRYAGGHVLACIRDHRPQLHLEFLHERFSRSRRTPVEIDGLAKSMAPLAEKVLQSIPSW